MYKLHFPNSESCSIEFGIRTSKKKKIEVIKKFVSILNNSFPCFVGDVLGLDFTVEKLASLLKTNKVFLMKDNTPNYSILFFLSCFSFDYEIFLEYIDEFSEGKFSFYLLSKLTSWDNVSYHDIENIIANADISVSLFSDATYIEMTFKNKEVKDWFISELERN